MNLLSPTVDRGLVGGTETFKVRNLASNLVWNEASMGCVYDWNKIVQIICPSTDQEQFFKGNRESLVQTASGKTTKSL
jgi:hypothetical protein